MPCAKIWIHSVWSTKNRELLLDNSIHQTFFEHIHQNASNKNIFVEVLNGYTDHIHCLFRIRNEQTISKVMQLIKGESSFWMNHQELLKSKLQWQEEYFAVSV